MTKSLNQQQFDLLMEIVNHETFLEGCDELRSEVKYILLRAEYDEYEAKILRKLRANWIVHLTKNRIETFFVDYVTQL